MPAAEAVAEAVAVAAVVAQRRGAEARRGGGREETTPATTAGSGRQVQTGEGESAGRQAGGPSLTTTRGRRRRGGERKIIEEGPLRSNIDQPSPPLPLHCPRGILDNGAACAVRGPNLYTFHCRCSTYKVAPLPLHAVASQAPRVCLIFQGVILKIKVRAPLRTSSAKALGTGSPATTRMNATPRGGPLPTPQHLQRR